MDNIYINRTFIYTKSNIAGFELLDKKNNNFRKILYYEETIEYIKSIGGKIYNAEIFISKKNKLGENIYDIKADGKNLSNILHRDIIFNLSVLYNEREKYYIKYKEIFDKFICILNF